MSQHQCEPHEETQVLLMPGSDRLTMHNVHHLLSLMRRARNAILEGRYPEFVRGFFAKYFADKGVPEWAVDALKGVGIEI